MAGRGIKRAREGSEDMADADDPLDPLPAISHAQEIIGLFLELRRQAAGDEFAGSWGFNAMVSRALSGLLERFRGAERLGRPYVAWELLEAVDRELSEDCSISVLATTSVRKPTFFEEPISSQAYDSLDEIMGNGNMESLFRRLLEWCETGRVTQPTLYELAVSPDLPPAELSREHTDYMPEWELPFAPRASREHVGYTPEREFSFAPQEHAGYTPERELFSVPRAPRVPTGYTPEREFSFAPQEYIGYTPERELSFAPRAPREHTGYTPERELFSIPRAPRVPTGYTPERELFSVPRTTREHTGYTPERELSFAPRAPRIPTGYTPERELPHAPRRQATIGFASPADAQTNASASDRASPPQPEPGTHRAKKTRVVSKQTAACRPDDDGGDEDVLMSDGDDDENESGDDGDYEPTAA